MSTGHQSVPPHPVGSPEHDEHNALLEKLLSDPQFEAAVKAYTKENDSFDIPFLGGSNKSGDTVYFDRQFVEAIKQGKVLYDGKPYDPRPFLKVHEAVEGAAIRFLHANYDTNNAQGLPGGHLIATWAERRAVQHAGLDWDKYEASIQSWIRKGEAEDAKGKTPPDLLTEPYIGTKQAGEVDQGEPAGKLPHDKVQYGPGHADGDHCAICKHYRGPNDCELVQPPIEPIGWCNKFEAAMKPMANPSKMHALSIASATHLHKAGHISGKMKNTIHGKAKAGLAHAKVKKMAAMPFGSLAPMNDADGDEHA